MSKGTMKTNLSAREKAEARKAMKKEIFQHIAGTSVPNMMKLVFVLAKTLELLDEQTFRMIRGIFRAHGYIVRENDILSGIADYCRKRRQASASFEDRYEQMIASTTFNAGGVKTYDHFNEDCNEILRLVMLYLDRCAGSDSAHLQVFGLLEGMPSSGLFTKEDIQRFVMR